MNPSSSSTSPAPAAARSRTGSHVTLLQTTTVVVAASAAALGRTAPAPGRPFSKRQASALLRCDRGTTLEELIRSRQIPVVPSPTGRGIRIPSSEVERILRDGIAPAAPEAPPPRAARARRGARRTFADEAA